MLTDCSLDWLQEVAAASLRIKARTAALDLQTGYAAAAACQSRAGIRVLETLGAALGREAATPLLAFERQDRSGGNHDHSMASRPARTPMKPVRKASTTPK